jgi:GNAT superfamily N-acetyltransferase
MVSIRRARPGDAAGIGVVHVGAWRSAYAGILPDAYLANLSIPRMAASYERAIADRRDCHAVFVAVAGSEVVGFASGGRARRQGIGNAAGCQGEVETLYLLDDWRERGLGRRLMRAMAAHLGAVGCRSVMLWVLQDNPTCWFYRHLGGRPVLHEGIRYAGHPLQQVAYLWEPIEALLAATAPAREG